jgi:hypothetical protein
MQLHEMLYTDSHDILALASTLERAITTAAKMAVPAPEIMDNSHILSSHNNIITTTVWT